MDQRSSLDAFTSHGPRNRVLNLPALGFTDEADYATPDPLTGFQGLVYGLPLVRWKILGELWDPLTAPLVELWFHGTPIFMKIFLRRS